MGQKISREWAEDKQGMEQKISRKWS